MYTYSEVCPKCGGLIESIVICTYPPINNKRCTRCGATWERHPNYATSAFSPSVFNPEEQGYTEINSGVTSDESNTSNH